MAGVAYIPPPWPFPLLRPMLTLAQTCFSITALLAPITAQCASSTAEFNMRSVLLSNLSLLEWRIFPLLGPPPPPVAPHAYLGENMFLQNSIACSKGSPMCFKNKLNSIRALCLRWCSAARRSYMMVMHSGKWRAATKCDTSAAEISPWGALLPLALPSTLLHSEKCTSHQLACTVSQPLGIKKT